MKVNHVFKAKKVTFRERDPQKVKNDLIFAHLTLRILGRDENRISMIFFQNLVPNPTPSAILAQLESSPLNRDSTCSLLVENLREFQ